MSINYTNRLYEPLRTTLDKSMVRNPQLNLATSRLYQQVGPTSRISRRMRSLSPDQAKFIKSSTFIPANKQLVPTGNLWKVRGKQFTAVDVQVKRGQPIPASQLRFDPSLRGTKITKQTVYQAMPRQSQIRNFSNTRSITNLRTLYPPPPSNIVRTSNVYAQPTIAKRTASPVRVTMTPNLPIFNSNIQPIQPIKSAQSIQPSISYNQTQPSPPKINIKQPNPTPNHQYYGNSLHQAEIEKSNKNKYKYNFFSAFDQAINTKCGSCGSNQIIASKPFSSWQ